MKRLFLSKHPIPELLSRREILEELVRQGYRYYGDLSTFCRMFERFQVAAWMEGA